MGEKPAQFQVGGVGPTGAPADAGRGRSGDVSSWWRSPRAKCLPRSWWKSLWCIGSPSEFRYNEKIDISEPARCQAHLLENLWLAGFRDAARGTWVAPTVRTATRCRIAGIARTPGGSAGAGGGMSPPTAGEHSRPWLSDLAVRTDRSVLCRSAKSSGQAPGQVHAMPMPRRRLDQIFYSGLLLAIRNGLATARVAAACEAAASPFPEPLPNHINPPRGNQDGARSINC